MRDITDFEFSSPREPAPMKTQASPEAIAPLSAAATFNAFERLRALLKSLGPESNKHDRALVLISACIAEGIDTRPRILGALHLLGFNRGHGAILLREGTGTSPDAHRWRKAADGRYKTLD